jgi:hypothetical protein
MMELLPVVRRLAGAGNLANTLDKSSIALTAFGYAGDIAIYPIAHILNTIFPHWPLFAISKASSNCCNAYVWVTTALTSTAFESSMARA